MKAVVTGGCGFIGGHVVDRLLKEGWAVDVIDNHSTSRKIHYVHNLENPNYRLHEFDLSDLERTKEVIAGADTIFHLAANADIRHGLEDTFRDLDRNVLTTYNVLEAMRINNVKKIVFSSTAASYGEPDVFPTPETYVPTQTSFYGASKLASEAFIEAFCEAYDMQSWIFRFVSVVGDRHPHGVTYDFVKKLLDNPNELEILGDGNQKKSYMHINDCMDGVFLAIEKMDGKVNRFNIGNDKYIDVKTVANIITDEMGLSNVEYKFTGGERGWIGDSPFVFLSLDRIKALGWSPKITVEEAIRSTARWLLENRESMY